MTTKELASILGNTDRTVRRWCKKALKEGENTIDTVTDGIYSFIKTDEGYDLTKKETFTPKPRKTTSKNIAFAHLAELNDFDISKGRFTKEEKLLLITFIRKYNYTLNIIIEGLLRQVGEEATIKRLASWRKKIHNWKADFKEGGLSALSDKRGKTRAKFSKIEEDLLISAIEGAGAKGVRKNYYGVYDFYCYLWQERHSDVFTSKNEDIISYSAMVKGIEKLLKEYAHLKDYWTGGEDALLQSYPVGIKDIKHPNQEWQVDATKFDFMCHYEDKDGIARKGRLNLTAVIDVYSGSVVATLSERITSYDQVRVLHKAFGRMGLPEQVYTDNGKDYVSYHYSDVLFDLGITQITAQAGQGRQKGKIERFFGKFQTELAKLNGYMGNSVAKRKIIEDQTASHIGVKTGKETRTPSHRLLKVEEWQTIVDNICAKYSENYSVQEHNLLSIEALEDVRQKLGKKSLRPLHNDGIKLNSYTYISSALWTGGLAKGNELEVYEDIDDVNVVYVYKEGKFIAKALNKEVGSEAMSMEEHRDARNSDRKNNVAPRQKSVKNSKKQYERYQDHNVEQILNATPDYAKPKPKEETVKPAVNNDYKKWVLAQEA